MVQSRFHFSRASRLLKPSEFQTVFDARKACRGHWLTVHRREDECLAAERMHSEQTDLIHTGNSSRLGLIVAKRLVPAAARRNLIRRVLREYFRTQRETFPVVGDWIIRLHASPFPSRAQIRKGKPMPTRLQIVNGLRTDLTQILRRVEGHVTGKRDLSAE